MSACHEKTAFPTREAAEARAHELRLTAKVDPRLLPYACPECDAWHLYTKQPTAAISRSHWLRTEAGYWLDRLRGSRGRY